jgi:hypothetical protein
MFGAKTIRELPNGLDGENILTRLPEPVRNQTVENAPIGGHLERAVGGAHRLIQRNFSNQTIARDRCCRKRGETDRRKMRRLDWYRGMAMLIMSGAVQRTSGGREGYHFVVNEQDAYALVDEFRKRTLPLINAGRQITWLKGSPLPKNQR